MLFLQNILLAQNVIILICDLRIILIYIGATEMTKLNLRAPFAKKVLVSALLSAVTVHTYAQSSANKELDTVVVTAGSVEQTVKDAPASISVITRDDIEKNNYSSVQDAVSKLEGVTVTGNDPKKKDITMRGLSGEYTLILVDGIRQGTRETMKSYTGGVQGNLLPPMEAIERIEVVRGPMSSLYGSDAMGGVINVITKKVGDKWHGAASIGGVLNEDSDHGNSHQTEFWFGGPIKNDVLGIQFSGKYAQRSEDDVYYQYSKDSGSAGSKNQRLSTKITAKPSSNQTVNLTVTGEELEYTQTLGRSISAIPSATAPTSTEDKHKRNQVTLDHEGQWDWGKTWLSASYENEKLENSGQNNSQSKLPVANPDLDNYVIDGLVTLPLKQNLLKVGAQYRYSKLSSIKADATGPGASDELTSKNLAIFAEDDWFITDKLTLTGGTRLEHNNEYGNHWTPRLYAVYKATDALTLKGGIAKGFKTPTLRQSSDSYCTTTNGPLAINGSKSGLLCGNSNLKPETSVTKEIGMSYDFGEQRTVSLTLFDTKFKNKIVSYATGNTSSYVSSMNEFIYDNVDKATIRGVELALNYAITPRIEWDTNYTYTYSHREGGGETTQGGKSLDGRALAQTPKNLVNTKLNWQATDALNTYIGATYYGVSEWAAFRNGAADVRKRPGSTTYDFGGMYKINKNLNVSFAVLNLTDKVVPVDDRDRSVLEGNWMEDLGRRYAVTLNASF